jgi:tripartite-type tricarboxylate transporter receptor subunit TctC
MVRVLASEVAEQNSATVIIENRPGAGTLVGASGCKIASSDGKTICVLSNSSMLFNPHLYKSLPYRPKEDFEPVTMLAFSDHVVIMQKAIPADNFAEFVEYLRSILMR